MQVQPPRRRERGVDRLPVQVVGEPGRASPVGAPARGSRPPPPRRPASATRVGSSPVTSASTSGSSVRAGDRGRLQQRGAAGADSRASRRPMTSRTAAGTSVPVPPAASSWHSSRAKNGCPPLRSCTSARPAAGGAGAGDGPTRSATSAGDSPRSGTSSAAVASSASAAAISAAARPGGRRRPAAARRAAAGGPGSAAGPPWTGRPTAGRRGSPPPGSRRRPGAAAAPTASKTRSRPASSAPAARLIGGQLRHDRRQLGPGRRRASSARRSSSARSAWVHGHHAGAWSPSQQVPHTTVPPAAATSAGEPGQQRGLADPGLAGDQDQPGPAGDRAGRRRGDGLVGGGQPGQRLGAADEGGTHRHCRAARERGRTRCQPVSGGCHRRSGAYRVISAPDPAGGHR